MKKIMVVGATMVSLIWLFSFSDKENEFHISEELSKVDSKEVKEEVINLKVFNSIFSNALDGKIYGTIDSEEKGEFFYYINAKGEIIKSDKKNNINKLWKASDFKNNNSIWINEKLEINISNSKNSLKTLGKINLENFKNLDGFNYNVEFIDGTDRYGYIKVSKDSLSYDYIVDLDEEKLYIVELNNNEFLKIAYSSAFPKEEILCLRKNGDLSDIYLNNDKALIKKVSNINEAKDILEGGNGLATIGSLGEMILFNDCDKKNEVLAIIYNKLENKYQIIENEIEGRVVKYIENTNFIIVEKENKGSLEYFIAEIDFYGKFRLFRKINLEKEEKIETFSINAIDNKFMVFTSKDNLLILGY